MILTNKNDISAYFGMIEEIEPCRVLDIGMFLKRMGCVSRRVMDRGILEDIILEGMDLFPTINFPVWENIYDHIWSVEAFFKNENVKKYDLVILLGTADIEKEYELDTFIEIIRKNTEHLLIDQMKEEWKETFFYLRVKKFNIAEDDYYLVNFGE